LTEFNFSPVYESWTGAEALSDAHLLFVAGSVMFLLTMFLMDGPQKQEKPQDMGHENVGFTLDKIAEMNGVANRPAIESSRL
jgi:hypothetical protein